MGGRWRLGAVRVLKFAELLRFLAVLPRLGRLLDKDMRVILILISVDVVS